MSSFAPDGDAVRPDGTLKDASKIIWSYDADESIPFPLGSASGSHSGSHTLATNVAGVHRTTRISCPSQRYIEEAEPAPSASVRKFFGVKRKATSVTDLQGPPSERTPEEKLWDWKTRAQQYARDQRSCDDVRISYLEFLEMEAEDDLALARMIAG
jgi:hypothetical protein